MVDNTKILRALAAWFSGIVSAWVHGQVIGWQIF
jgi:hypothetical protein